MIINMIRGIFCARKFSVFHPHTSFDHRSYALPALRLATTDFPIFPLGRTASCEAVHHSGFVGVLPPYNLPLGNFSSIAFYKLDVNCIMSADKSLIDSFLGFGMNDSRNLTDNGMVGGDDARQVREMDSTADEARFRRPSDPKSPASADSMKYGSTPSGVGGILENSMDQQLHSKPDTFSGSDYSRSPKRFHQNADSNEGFTNDSFTLGALSRFNTDDESKTNGRFTQGGVMESGSYLIHEPEDGGNHAVPRGQLSSKVCLLLLA